jgi:hypothetical protein
LLGRSARDGIGKRQLAAVQALGVRALERAFGEFDIDERGSKFGTTIRLHARFARRGGRALGRGALARRSVLGTRRETMLEGALVGLQRLRRGRPEERGALGVDAVGVEITERDAVLQVVAFGFERAVMADFAARCL